MILGSAFICLLGAWKSDTVKGEEGQMAMPTKLDDHDVVKQSGTFYTALSMAQEKRGKEAKEPFRKGCGPSWETLSPTRSTWSPLAVVGKVCREEGPFRGAPGSVNRPSLKLSGSMIMLREDGVVILRGRAHVPGNLLAPCGVVCRSKPGPGWCCRCRTYGKRRKGTNRE
jgi:hypothetical protein